MSLFKTEGNQKEIDLTKLRGHIDFEIVKHVNKAGCEYFCIKAKFKDGTTLLVDMQLVELLNLKLHQAIGRSLGKHEKEDVMEQLIELVSGHNVRDAILKSIYD